MLAEQETLDERVKLDGLTGGVIRYACRTGDTDEV